MSSFPLDDLIPRKETQAYEFTSGNVETRIGILDTGVDPTAIEADVIQTLDCTGSGNVDVSTEVELSNEHKITALSGRTYTIPITDWNVQPFPNNDNSETTTTTTVRLGLLRAYDLFPKKLQHRVEPYRKRELEKQVQEWMVTVQQDLNKWHEEYTKNNKPTAEQLNTKHDLDAQLDFLQSSINKESEDDDSIIGPVHDVIVYFDGTNHRAVVVTDPSTFLPTKGGMAEYAVEQETCTFGTVDQFTFAIQFYNDYKTLSIVSDAGAHGTHVASIATGISTNSKVIALKIGDSRLGSMETGTSLVRGIVEAIRNQCHVVNLSYGEGCALANRGRIVECIEELVYRHNIVFVASAGNNGPALTTVGTPGGTSSATLSVGAYVSPAMMASNYSLITNRDDDEKDDSLIGTTFTWSSVGPTADGDFGVDVIAPGGAITSVPTWTLQRGQLMNGTSMSSPHVAGCVALLIGACLENNIPVHVPQLLRAIKNTAKPQDGLNVLQQGWGMIQVQDAYAYLEQHKDCLYNHVRFDVCVDNRPNQPRGIYLRQADEIAAGKQVYSIHVDPKFGYKNHDVSEQTQKDRIDFEMHVNLESTEPSWVKTPEHFELLHNGRSFKVEVDPTHLPVGVVSTAQVLGRDSQHPSRGVMFSVPITVVKPMPEQTNIDFGEIEFSPAEVKRFFLTVPHGATWMDLTVRDCRLPVDKDSSPRLIALHTVQLLPHEAYRHAQTKKYLNLVPSETTVTSVPVHAGITVELDLARYWSASGITKMEASVEFCGVMVVPHEVTMSCGFGGAQVRVESYIKDEIIMPSAKLTKHKTPLLPKSNVNNNCITPLDEYRDIMPDLKQRIYQLVLEYEYDSSSATKIIPRAPALQGVLYESVFESQMFMVFDSNKRRLGVADAWPKSEIAIPKGKVTIRLQVRHDSVQQLEKLKEMPIWIEQKLEKEISLSVYGSKEDLTTDKKFAKRKLRQGTSAAVFFGEPTKLPSGVKCGDILFGTANYCAGDAQLPGSGKKPGGFPISYVVGPTIEKKKEEPTVAEAPDERSASEKLNESVRDYKVTELEKLEGDSFREVYDSLIQEYPKHIPLLLAHAKHLDNAKENKDLDAVIAACDKVIGEIDENDLALFFGKQHDETDPSVKIKAKEMGETKSQLIQALTRKARAVFDKKEDASAVLKNLSSWKDIDESDDYAFLALLRDEQAMRYGLVLKRLTSLIGRCKNGELAKSNIGSTNTLPELLEKRCQILSKLGYKALAERDHDEKAISSPKNYALF